jgi:hypothetical protein
MTVNIDYVAAHPMVVVPHTLAQLARLAALDDSVVASHFPELTAYGQQWDAFVKVRPDAIDVRGIPMKPDSVRNIVLESIRSVQCTDKVPLARKFRLLLGAMTKLERLSRRPEFGSGWICNVLMQIPGRMWLVPFVIFNGTVAATTDFMSEDERKVWVKFESCALLVLQSCSGMLDSFTKEMSKLARDGHIMRWTMTPG